MGPQSYNPEAPRTNARRLVLIGMLALLAVAAPTVPAVSAESSNDEGILFGCIEDRPGETPPVWINTDACP